MGKERAWSHRGQVWGMDSVLEQGSVREREWDMDRHRERMSFLVQEWGIVRGLESGTVQVHMFFLGLG
jgi:hypothetical protein